MQSLPIWGFDLFCICNEVWLFWASTRALVCFACCIACKSYRATSGTPHRYALPGVAILQAAYVILNRYVLSIQHSIGFTVWRIYFQVMLKHRQPGSHTLHVLLSWDSLAGGDEGLRVFCADFLAAAAGWQECLPTRAMLGRGNLSGAFLYDASPLFVRGVHEFQMLFT